jgi:hypothetical protein
MKRKRLELNRPTMMPVAVWCSTVKYRFGTLMKTLCRPDSLRTNAA